ncbi:MAG: hypothetical protein WCC17_10780 [Candidatus Nitrosopolaris sp.]
MLTTVEKGEGGNTMIIKIENPLNIPGISGQCNVEASYENGSGNCDIMWDDTRMVAIAPAIISKSEGGIISKY